MTWTHERVEILRRLWADGHSAGQIARQIGGVSRNAVIGKIFRMELAGRATTSRVATGRRRAKIIGTGPKFQPGAASILAGLRRDGLPLPTPQETDIRRISFDDMEARKHCRWIPGDPRDVRLTEPLFCGLEPVPGLPYCAAHSLRSYNPPDPRRRDPLPQKAKELQTA